MGVTGGLVVVGHRGGFVVVDAGGWVVVVGGLPSPPWWWGVLNADGGRVEGGGLERPEARHEGRPRVSEGPRRATGAVVGDLGLGARCRSRRRRG